MLDNKTVSCLGNADARWQNRFLYSNRRCCAAGSFPARQQRFIVRQSGQFTTIVRA